jgi:hypothetical protein
MNPTKYGECLSVDIRLSLITVEVSGKKFHLDSGKKSTEE